MTPIERVMQNQYYTGIAGNRGWAILGRIILFMLVQMAALFVIFWAGIFTLIGSIWHADPNYIGIFLLLVCGFELLTLRILVRSRLIVILGIVLMAGGIWLQHHDKADYNGRTCQFIKQSTCQEFGNGYICRQESPGYVNERTISRDDVSACTALDEF